MPSRAKIPKAKNNPKLVSAARELRDRWMERRNDALLPAAGKYELTRGSIASAAPVERALPLLDAA